jgi:hypothetical protein
VCTVTTVVEIREMCGQWFLQGMAERYNRRNFVCLTMAMLVVE